MSIKYKLNTIYNNLLLLAGFLLVGNSYSQNLALDSIVYPTNSSITSSIKYFAKDSIISYPKDKIIELYNEAYIQYDDFELKAGYIRFNMKTDMVYAHGILDTAETLIQEPIFLQGGKTYNSDTILFNMKSKKGKIQKIATQEGEGFLYGHDIKKMPDNSLYFKNGIYTTCNHPEPHFYIKASKLKFTNDKKIITGPANLVIAGVKTPLVLPFGYFPLTDKNPVGIVIPSYNFSATRGYSLNGLGFYVGISEYWDNQITADLFTGGSFRFRNNFRYNKRYKYTGNLDFNYSYTSDLVNPNANQYNYSFGWRHIQDRKANPFSTFSANVDLRSGGFSQNNNENLNRQIQSSYNSSITYNRSLFNNKASINVTATHNLNNTGDKFVKMQLPDVILKSNTGIFPFRTKTNAAKKNFLSKIKIDPSLKAKTVVNTFDSLMFTSRMFNDLDVGAEYRIPVTIPLNFTKAFSIKPSFGYNGYIYTKKYHYNWNTETEELDKSSSDGIYHLYDYNASVNFNFAPTIYGLFNVNSKAVKAIRHVIDPFISYTYRFNIMDENRYYQDVQVDSSGTFGFRSQYNQGTSSLYSVPGSPIRNTKHRWGSMSFGIANNIEMKVRDKSVSKSDSLALKNGVSENQLDVKYKKLKIFDQFDFRSGYNFDVDSFNLNHITLDTRTILGNNFSVRNTLTFDPYANDGHSKINKYFWEDNAFFPRLQSMTTNLNYSLSGKSKTGKTTEDKLNNVNQDLLSDKELRDFNEIKHNSHNYIDFDIPYTLKLGYSLTYAKPIEGERTLNQSVTFSGDISLTDNWKIEYSSGFDITNKKMANSQFTFRRDLHCWQMSLNWVPFGTYRSYGFAISVKASVLQDLKLNKRKATYDRFF